MLCAEKWVTSFWKLLDFFLCWNVMWPQKSNVVMSSTVTMWYTRQIVRYIVFDRFCYYCIVLFLCAFLIFVKRLSLFIILMSSLVCLSFSNCSNFHFALYILLFLCSKILRFWTEKLWIFKLLGMTLNWHPLAYFQSSFLTSERMLKISYWWFDFQTIQQNTKSLLVWLKKGIHLTWTCWA